jgi:hypothetical protein
VLQYPYNTHNREGGTCKRVPAAQQKSIAVKSDYDRVAELVLVPDSCARRYRLRELYQLRNPKSEAEKDHLPDGVIPTPDFLRTHDPDWPR